MFLYTKFYQDQTTNFAVSKRAKNSQIKRYSQSPVKLAFLYQKLKMIGQQVLKLMKILSLQTTRICLDAA